MLALRNSVSSAARDLLGLSERPLIPTAEQRQVVDAVTDALTRNANGEGVMKISVPGVAGASKTTTLKMVNDAVGSLNGRKGIFSLSKSAVNELKTRMAHEVDKIGTVHSRYFSTLNDLYRATWGREALMKLGIDEGSAESHLTVSYDGSVNYVLLQHMLADRTAAPPRPSVEYQLAGTFVVQLYDKAQLHGFGLPDQPAMNDADALRRLVERYNLAHKLERKYLDGNSVQQREFTALVGEDSTEARLAHGISLVPRLHELAAEAAVNPKVLGATDMLNFARPAHHISLPCVNYTGMIYFVLLNEQRVLGFDGHPFRLVFVDEANDNSILVSLAVLNMLSPSTVLVSFGDKNQRIFAFAGADSIAYQLLEDGATRYPLADCYRNPRSHIELAQQCLRDDCGDFETVIRPVRDEDGIIVYSGTLADGTLGRYHLDGSVVIIARSTCVLIAFAQWFMRMGVRFTFPNKLDVKVSLTHMLDGFQARCLVDVIRGLRDLILQRRYNSPLEVDYAYSLMMLTKQVLERVGVDEAWLPESLTALKARIEGFFRGHTTDAPLPGVVVLSNVHGVKGHTYTTAILAEPNSMMLEGVVKRGGPLAEDEAHIKYVSLTRATLRLVFLKDVFFSQGFGALEALLSNCTAPDAHPSDASASA